MFLFAGKSNLQVKLREIGVHDLFCYDIRIFIFILEFLSFGKDQTEVKVLEAECMY